MSLLSIRNLNKSFGGLKATDNLTMTVEQGQFFGIIGANGAGKTTLLNLITGYLKPTSGSVTFDGHDVTGLPPYRLAHLGIGRTFQIVQPFAEMSVRENVMTGALFSRLGGRRSLAEARRFCDGPLELAGLSALSEVPAGSLTLGAKKKLELARVLATEPKLMLLDEVMGGLTRPEIENISEVLAKIHASGTTIMMIEHHVHVITDLCDYVYVLNFGRELFQGFPDDVASHPEVIEAYLGVPMERVERVRA